MANTLHLKHFKLAVKWLFDIAEKGESNRKADRGGHTKYGISKKAYPHLDISKVTRPFAEKIYLKDYWYLANCDDLPYPINVAVFDAAVNHGVFRAQWLLQDVIGAKRDGIIGPRTLKKVSQLNLQELFVDYNRRRVQFFYAICSNDRSQLENLNGWINRLFRLTQYIYQRG